MGKYHSPSWEGKANHANLKTLEFEKIRPHYFLKLLVIVDAAMVPKPLKKGKQPAFIFRAPFVEEVFRWHSPVRQYRVLDRPKSSPVYYVFPAHASH